MTPLGYSAAIACGIALSAGHAVGAPFDYVKMLPGVHPVIDGSVTNADEWANAKHTRNNLNSGTYRAQYQNNWTATSSSSSTATYTGTTAFLLHDLWGYESSEAADYNTFSFSVGGATLKAWIFANGNEAIDSAWIAHSGLGAGYSSIDDRGFLVRINGDPSTDRHWLPGDPEPGDSGWNWATYYGFFGRDGFDDSASANGLPLSVNGQANEVYELALYGGAPGSTPIGPIPPIKPSTVTLTQTISDPKNGDPSLSQVVLINGSAHIPEPGPLLLLAVPVLGWVGRTLHDRSTAKHRR